MNADQWPFDQPPNCAVISPRSIVFSGVPILHLSYEADDHGWQFLEGGDVVMEDAAVICLDEIVRLDQTIVDVADLPPGWIAWRAAKDAPWQRGPR